jgi:hypothetical protein
VADGAQVPAPLGGVPSDPVQYSPELADLICETVGRTPRGLEYLCATEPGWPSRRTVDHWLARYPEFRAEFDIAKERQAELLAFEGLEIADDASRDTKTVIRRDGTQEQVCDFEWVARSKLRIEQRRWLAAKLAPKKFGDKLDLNASIGVLRHEDALELLR